MGAQYFGSSDGAGHKTKSNGYFLQATYKLGDTKFGVNHGQNTDEDGVLGNGNELKNRSYTLGAYHSLNKYVTLVGEVNNEKQSSNGTQSEKNNTVTLGAIMFFRARNGTKRGRRPKAAAPAATSDADRRRDATGRTSSSR